MSEKMKQVLGRAEEKVAAIEALWQSTPPQIWMNDSRLPDEIRDLAQVSHLLLVLVAQQQEEIEALKERMR